jgi:uncharacterized protein YkwD
LGWIVSVHFYPYEADVTGVRATLTDADGKPVEALLSTPQQPADPSYRQPMVALFPRSPLKPGTTYTVQMSARLGGKAWEKKWSFTLAKHDGIDPERVRVSSLEAINRARKAANLEPVTMDESLSRGCERHAEYIARNQGHPSLAGLGMHNEKKDLPGYTPEGERAGQASDIATGTDPFSGAEFWINSLYHRIPILDPKLRRIGCGMVRLADGMYCTVVDVQSGRQGP